VVNKTIPDQATSIGQRKDRKLRQVHIPVYEVVIQSEFEDKRAKRLQDLSWLIVGLIIILW
jgi:hypothetical protein